MAETKGRRAAAADFVSKIVKDPKQPPNTLLLKGYLGDSSEEGYTRLYLDPQLSDYVEIPDDAILNTQDIPRSDQSPLGGSYVWIQRDAEVLHGRVGSDRLKAKFLEGRIYQQYMKGAQFGGARAIPPDSLFCEPTQHPGCPQTLQCEQTKPPLCPPSIFDGPCPTDPRICPPPNRTWLGLCPPNSVFNPPCPVAHPSVLPQFCPPPNRTWLGLCPPDSVFNPPCPVAQPTPGFPQCPPESHWWGCPPSRFPQECEVVSAYCPSHYQPLCPTYDGWKCITHPNNPNCATRVGAECGSRFWCPPSQPQQC